MQNPEVITYCHSIGLCNVIYKIFSKVVVNTIKPVLNNLIGKEQTCFVPNHQIIDNIVIAQEVIHSMRTKSGNNHMFAIKVDLENAYDHLN